MDWALPFAKTGQDETCKDERFEQVYRETADLVRSAIFLLGGEQDLDDIIQETFVKIWSGLDRFEGRSSLKTWAYRIAVNTSRQHWRAHSRRLSQLQKPVEHLPEPTYTAPEVDLKILIQLGLGKLNIDQREVFVLHYYEDLPLREIAEVCGVPEGTVKSRLYYARKAMQEFLRTQGVKW